MPDTQATATSAVPPAPSTEAASRTTGKRISQILESLSPFLEGDAEAMERFRELEMLVWQFGCEMEEEALDHLVVGLIIPESTVDSGARWRAVRPTTFDPIRTHEIQEDHFRELIAESPESMAAYKELQELTRKQYTESLRPEDDLCR